MAIFPTALANSAFVSVASARAESPKMVTRYTSGKVSKLAEADCPQDGDALAGGWSREALLDMDARFCERMERAIARGLERRPDGERPVRAA